jgi:hypothetical protein
MVSPQRGERRHQSKGRASDIVVVVFVLMNNDDCVL